MTDNLIDKGTDNTDQLDPSVNYLKELVGDGKKFKTPEDLAYGKAQSDSYIKILERQMDQLRTDYEAARVEAAARTRVEELLNKFDKPGTKEPTVPETPPKSEISLAEIETLMANKIQQTETERRQKENLDRVKSELNRRFGNNLEHHLKEVGLDGESAAQLAKVNPQLVLKALGVEKSSDQGFTAPPRNTSVNTPNRNAPQRTWQYYQDLFKSNPSLKYDPKTNTQMQKDYAALGQTFEDGDFHRFG